MSNHVMEQFQDMHDLRIQSTLSFGHDMCRYSTVICLRERARDARLRVCVATEPDCVAHRTLEVT